LARSKEFETKRALAAAMNVFWRLGYGNTSLEVLLGEMGIAKQSLYDTFGDKRALYFKAMALYRAETNSSIASCSIPSSSKGGVHWPSQRAHRGVEGAARARLLAVKREHGRAVDDPEIAEFCGTIKRKWSQFCGGPTTRAI
jgi:TetR/AcrR family transcriptional repressor of nem operon